MRISIAIALLAAMPASSQTLSGPVTVTTMLQDEWVLATFSPAPGSNVTAQIASQRFATEADCKALADQLRASVPGPGIVTARCFKARIITPPRN